MFDHIFCFVGPSGSGKTTVAKMLSHKYNVIQSYTTRGKRSEDEWGHLFATVEDYQNTCPYSIVADNTFNGNIYWATREQFEGKGVSIYVIEPVGVESIIRNKKNYDVTVIFFRISKEVAIERMASTRGLDSAIQRVAHDVHVFDKVKCDYVVDADMDINIVCNNVKSIISP